MREYMELSQEIEEAIEGRVDFNERLARWNARAVRPYSPDEFRYYPASTSRETFVETMLLGAPVMVSDLTYSEAKEVVTVVSTAKLPEAMLNHFIEWLEVNFPNGNITNLIYWPNHWFGDESMLQVELTPDQILAYAMAKSGRRLPGAPANVPMPYPIPPSA
jgi:hypothetical protein